MTLASDAVGLSVESAFVRLARKGFFIFLVLGPLSGLGWGGAHLFSPPL